MSLTAVYRHPSRLPVKGFPALVRLQGPPSLEMGRILAIQVQARDKT